MDPIDELSPEEIREAIRLAIEMGDPAVPATSGPAAVKETGLNLAKAVSLVRRKRAGIRRQEFVKRAAQLVAVIVAFAIVDAILIARRPHTVTQAVSSSVGQAAPSTAPIVVQLPPPDKSLLSGIPISGPLPFRLKSFPQDQPTSIIFENHLNKPVHIDWIDYRGREKPIATLQPRQVREQPTTFFSPFVVTDDSGAFRRLYFAQGRPMTAILQATGDTSRQGYWPTITKDQFPSQIRTSSTKATDYKSPTGIDLSYIAIVNLTNKPLNVYSVMATANSNFIQTLNPGDYLDTATTPGTFWSVTDDHGNVVARYANPPITRVAVIQDSDLPSNGAVSP